jgi:flagellar biosynthesis/type III secretory pathway chaperone
VNALPFQALISTMTALNGFHNTLLELVDDKKHVLIHNNVEKLTQIIAKENKLMKQIGEMDRQRVEAIGNFLVDRGFKPNPKVTVSDLSKIIFNVEDKNVLKDLQKQLTSTIHKLRQKNVVNQQLIEQSLAFIDYSLDLYVGTPEEDAFYHNPQKQAKGNKRPGLFDAKA